MATDAGVFSWPQQSGTGVPTFPNLAAFPSPVTSGNGYLAIALDTHILYESDGTQWVPIAGPGVALSIGTFDSGVASANGAHIDSNALIMQSASASVPGLVNISTQTFAGDKTFTGNIYTTAKLGVGTTSVSAALDVHSSTNPTAQFTNTGAQSSSGGASAGVYADPGAAILSGSRLGFYGFGGSFDTSHTLVNGTAIQSFATENWSSTARGSKLGFYITQNTTTGVALALTIDQDKSVTAVGNISAANLSGTNTGDVTIGTANGLSLSGQQLSLGLSSTSTTGALSSTDWNTFNNKQAAGNYITALTGDGTATGPGSVALTLATVNANTGSFGSSTAIPNFTVNAKGLITAAGTNAVIAPAGTLTGTTLASNVVTSSLTTVGTIATGTWSATTIAINKGGTGVTSVTTTPTASAWAGWDANKNLSANNVQDGYTATATAAGTTTLTVSSTGQQVFTGSTTQTCVLPAVSTLALGTDFIITNLSSGVVTVQSSGLNTIQAMAANSQLVVTSIATSGTGTAAWTWTYTPISPSGLPLTNPMTTGGDTIYGGASGVPTRLANGTSGQYLSSQGGTSAPQWLSFTNFSVTTLTSTGTTAGYRFTITSGNATAGATYTNNGNTYTVIKTISAQTSVFMSGAAAPTASGTLTKASGTGDATLTFSANNALASYTPPSTAKALWVRSVASGGSGGGTAATSAGQSSCAGGGGGGGYSEKLITSFDATIYYEVGASVAGASAGNNGGSVGKQTTFVDSQNLLTCLGGNGGAGAGSGGAGFQSNSGVSGGGASGGDLNINGQPAVTAFCITAGSQQMGGSGGASCLGPGGSSSINTVGGSNAPSGYGGGGGGAAAGASQAAQAGGNSAAGVIIIHELFNGH